MSAQPRPEDTEEPSDNRRRAGCHAICTAALCRPVDFVDEALTANQAYRFYGSNRESQSGA